MEQNRTTTPGKRRTNKKAEEPEAGPEAAAAATPADDAATPEEGLDERMLAALHAAGDKKAHDLVVLDLRPVATFTDYFLIASGTNARQVQAIADEVTERLKREGTRAERIEGYKTAEWVLVDYGDFICHIFEDKARRFYDLERLWREGIRVPLPADLQAEAGGGGSAGGSLRNES